MLSLEKSSKSLRINAILHNLFQKIEEREHFLFQFMKLVIPSYQNQRQFVKRKKKKENYRIMSIPLNITEE